MRISDKKGSRQVAKKDGKASPIKAGGGSSSTFVTKLQRLSVNSADYAGKLQELKEEIDRAGDTLDREPTIANFKVFRELLGSMAKKISADAYRMELVSGTSNTHVLEVMTVIDREADTLYHLIIKEHKDHIRITSQIMKIKGLVVDFLL